MLADALAQFLMVKRWDDWFLVEGSHPEDQALAEAYRRAAEKFGAEIVEIRIYEDTGGARRTDSGHVQVQAQMPVFTQGAPEPRRAGGGRREPGLRRATCPTTPGTPRPGGGLGGPRARSPGTRRTRPGAATQLQTRFEKAGGAADAAGGLQRLDGAPRRRRGRDPRPTPPTPATLRDYILGPDFELGAFKGQPLSFRDWDGQLRQPILLAADNVVVSVSPQDEFVHQFSPLDTLGTDRPETECRR